MIVIDANILIYSLIECDFTPQITRLRQQDADWRTTPLCLHEVLNVLATYQRRELLTPAQCNKLLEVARRFIAQAAEETDLPLALKLAGKFGITGYDAEYIALAQTLGTPLITEDRKLRNAVPQLTQSLQQYLDRP
jgi:predicted nucleic acid-binding protein